MALSPPARMMISPNSCGEARRPLVSICQESWAVSGMGASPRRPGENCEFCSRTAAATSATVSPYLASLSGTSQMRMA